ncbi:MAG: co-chaperone GroES [Planctomycetota bacterium]|nr:MAG: co-chaperone GroES [Planctomycetota bacterium]
MEIPHFSLDHFIVIGDRVLVQPITKKKTKAGLYLPPSVHEKEAIQFGKVIKVGPGYPLANPADFDEVYKEKQEAVRYIPLQVKKGDLAIYLPKQGHEFEYFEEKYIIVPQGAILLVIREELEDWEETF